MDEVWQVKCGSPWPPPPASLPAAQPPVAPLMSSPLAPPPIVAASQVLPPAAGHQMDVNSHQRLHPFISWEANVQDRAFIQEPLSFNSLNADFFKPSKTEMGNSFLALLSGPSHPLPREFPQLPRSGSSFATSKLPACDMGNAAGDVDCRVSVPYISALSAHHGSNMIANSAEYSSYFVARLPSNSASTQLPVLRNGLQVVGSQFPSSNAGKPVALQAHQSSERALAVSPANSKNASQCQKLNVWTHPGRQLDTSINISSHASSYIRGCPRVFCMGRVGELFVSDYGLLGVFCLCHSMRMSVAKFCEHSGSHAVNPGDAVHLENGETVAQWRRLFFLNIGVRVPDDGSGWDWPDGTFMPGSFVRPKAKNLPSLKNTEAFQMQEPLAEIGRSEGLPNGHMSHYSHMGTIALEKLLNNFQENTEHRNFHEGSNRSFMGSTHSMNEHMLKELMGSHPFVNPSMMNPHFTTGQQNGGNKLISDNISVAGKAGNFPILYPSSQPLKSFGGNFDANGNSISSNAQFMKRDSTPSSIELRLGQPSQQDHNFIMSTTAATCPRQFLTQFGPHKQPMHKSITQGSVLSGLPEQMTQNLYSTPSQVSTANGTLLGYACGNTDVLHVPEQEAAKVDTDKNSLISLFLSHLNTSEGKTKSKIVENIARRENSVPNLVDCSSLSAKCSTIDFSRNVSNGIEIKSNVNTPEFSNHMEKGKGLRIPRDDEYCTAKFYTSLQNKQMGDLRVFAESIDGHSGHSISSSDRQHATCFHQSFSRLLEEPDARHSDEFGQTSFLANADVHDSVFLRCRSAGTSLSASPTSSFFSSNPTCKSTSAQALSNKMTINVTQHLMDENMRFPALKHAMKLSNQAHLPASLEINTQQLCCPSGMGICRKGSKEDLVASEDHRHRQHYSTVQEASRVAFRALHSCCNCCSHGVSGKTGITGTDRICNQKSCTKEPHVKASSCHACNDDEQSFLRFFRTDNKITEFAERGMPNEEGSCYIPSKCSCGMHSKCLKECQVCGGESHSDSFKEYGVCGKSHILLASAYDVGHLSQDGNRITLGQCDGSSHAIVNVDCQSSPITDVPGKGLGTSDAITNQKTLEKLPAAGSIDYQITESAAKNFDGIHEETDSREQRMSNIYSACSGPVVTEVSVEENNLDSCTGGTGDARSLHDPLIDEGSVIEKCGSSDDLFDNAGWGDKAVTVEGIVDPQKVSDYVSYHKSRDQTAETNHQSGDFISQLNLGQSFIPRKKRNQLRVECTAKESNRKREPITRFWRAARKKKATKWRRLCDSFTTSSLCLIPRDSTDCNDHLKLQCSSERMELPGHPGNTQRKCINSNKFSGVKRKRYASSSAESLSWKISDDHHSMCKDDIQRQPVDCDSSNRMSKTSAGTKVKRNFATDEKEETREQEKDPELTGKILKDVSRTPKCCLTGRMCLQERMVRPVVCGNSGIISNGNLSGKSKPVKIVSLNLVLKLAKRYNISENEKEPSHTFNLQMENADCINSKGGSHELSIMKGKRDTRARNLVSNFNALVKARAKETRKRRLSEITGNSKDTKDTLHEPSLSESRCSKLMQAGCHLKKSLMTQASDDLVGADPQHKKCQVRQLSKCSQQLHSRSGKNPQESPGYVVEPCHVNARKFQFSNRGRKCQQSLLDSDAFCCVCGSSNNDDVNHLLECKNCFIRVHQACYGVSKVPKGHWCCRPCRANSRNIACVLCGYEGGAMTRAVRCRNMVKSLLRTWKEGTEYPSVKSAPGAVDDDKTLNPCSEVQNSITAGAFDPTVTQWVHVVCGLWTPGTRCPNVDTMSAFDVSGVLPVTRKMACSMCNRPGGSCIQCRVVDCSIHFHPWCAHQKGLLQSEIEGVDNENVGFYGRCLIHATHHSYPDDGIPVDAGMESPKLKEFSCARTEGYKGRQKEHGFIYTFRNPSNDNSRCIVPQEQLNAWLHINGQKSGTKGLLKPPASETDYDCRKEYARYKQAKGWKHLVVYKSRIHALGLYTSQFIPRGAMVVEYVGEIVGLRVADKREIEYQSGKKLQYKSACYFFRIDKGHIIDATRKGGIARFVNHSCLPNCVAKIISVRNEKKVVFFAERDINPGEEITYDYHFNHEEEGKKIPCFCHSKNCRRYLN